MTKRSRGIVKRAIDATRNAAQTVQSKKLPEKLKRLQLPTPLRILLLRPKMPQGTRVETLPEMPLRLIKLRHLRETNKLGE